MANVIHFSRGSKVLLKGTIFIIFGVALFSIFSFTYRRYKSADNLNDGQIENSEKSMMMPYPDDMVRPEHRIDFNNAEKVVHDKSTCYNNLPRPVRSACLPFYVLVDIEGVNAYILQNFLTRCRNIMVPEPPGTSYFMQYPNMDDVHERQLLGYLHQFRQFSRRIMRRRGDFIYGDMGKFGPRPYTIDPNSDLAVPVLTPLNLLHDLNPKMKVIFMVRNPTTAVFVAYCAAGYPIDEFETEVDKGIAVFNACKQNIGFVPCEFRPEMHDPTTLKVRVVSYIYSFWIRKMAEIFTSDEYKIVLYENLVKPGTQLETLKDILEFLGFDDITIDELRDKINEGEGGEGGEGEPGAAPPPAKCDISQIPAGAKEKLDKFFEAFNLIIKEEFNEEYFLGWSYPDRR